MKMITTLANRLAEAILFDWDKEEVIKLAKEVAVACHENNEFVSLVKKMREAQKEYEDAIDKVYSTHAFFGDNIPYEVQELLRKLTKKKKALQKEVDEYLKKMEDLK